MATIEEDLFAGIDDDGDLVDVDLDDLSSSPNGISVNSEDKAVGLEEMERALDEAFLQTMTILDLSHSDDGGTSQDEIETLLAADDDELNEDFGSDSGLECQCLMICYPG
ncbi:hypothetical protein P4S72_03920 [Vibrio sp. PP-XX7]